MMEIISTVYLWLICLMVSLPFPSNLSSEAPGRFAESVVCTAAFEGNGNSGIS